MRFANLAGPAVVTAIIAGCGGSPSNPVAAPVNTTASQPLAAKEASPSATEVAVDIKSWEEIQSWVANQHGKVVVLDIWSNSCVECMREFPQFVNLHQELHARVACASVNVDYYGGDADIGEEIKPRVLKFLSSRNASMQNFISSDADEDVFRNIDTASIPAAVVYDREGKVHTVFNNDEAAYGPSGFNYEEHIKPLVEQLLASEDASHP